MHRKYRRDSKPNQNSCLAPAATSIGAAVFLALYGLPRCATAQQATTTATELEEVTVTATRRSETLESVPYAISVVGAQALETGDIIDIASLAEQVPGLSTFNYGARLVASTVPIIRGINASGTPRGFRSFEQAPVGTYVGNSPIDGYFQLYDIQRVEVLRGPQGTLYGAGALGGALRFIPNSPELNQFSASVEASGGKVTHSSEPAYTYSGLVNVPIGDTLAFRASGKYASEPGWISAYGLFTRNEDNQFGVPVLANPSDPVNSSPIYHSVSDWNWEKTATARASLLWKPNEAFSLEAADLYSNLWGTGGPQVNFQFPGGVSPIDPTHTLPAGGHYQEFTQVDQPYHRTTNLASLDLSYDAGFATLSATSSYITGNAITQEDQTYNLLGVGGGFYVQYYSGVPQNPRFVYTQSFADNTFVFSQEVRLVSKTGPDKMFDYVVGVFYEDSHREGIWNVVNPGSPERSVSQGCTSAVFAGSSFPNCLLVSGPKDLIFIQDDQQTFVDKSVFGELTWHFLQHGAITGGVRHFSQQFTDAQLYLDYTFPTYIPPTPHQSPASKTVGKVDVSYEYTTGQYVYALWSQGFRRGGANSVPYSGFFEEAPQLRYYQPDETNNYEVGLKGRFDNGLSYTASLFDIKWNKPQISASLPSGNLAVYNGNNAESKGFELESSGPLFVKGLTYTIGYAYVDAKLTSGFSLPANNGLGVIVPGLLTGKAGEQLPGSPKNSVSATINYNLKFAPTYDLLLSINGTYQSLIAFDLAPSIGNNGIRSSSSFEEMNFTAALTHNSWRFVLYCNNLTDRQNLLVPPTQPNEVNGLTNDFVVSPPRETGIRIGYKF